MGLIGGSIGLAARRRLGRRGGRLRAQRRRRSTRAVELGALDRGAGSRRRGLRGGRGRLLRRPGRRRCRSQAREALAASGPETVVTDVGSTKGELVAALGDDERFIGGHPLAGAETAGVENARADLFEGARWYLTPTERSSGVLYDRLQRTVSDLGARPQAIDAAAHDRLMATISHLPHVVANALVAEAAAELSRDSERMPEVGPSFRDTTRVAGSNPAIWADIFASNREAVADSVEAVARAPRRGRRADPRRRPRRRRRLARRRRRGPPPPARVRAARRGRCASCGSSSPTSRGRSPSWRWRSARPGSTSRTWRCYPAPDMTSGAVTALGRRRRAGRAGARRWSASSATPSPCSAPAQ